LALKKGDALLLCSDGLSGFVKDGPIRKVLARQRDVQRIPGDLANLALSAGGNDNITIQFVRVGGRSRGLVGTRLPVLVGAAAGSSAIALGFAAFLTTGPVATPPAATRPVTTRPDIFIAPDNVSEDRRSFTGTPTTPAAPSRLEAPAVSTVARPSPGTPAPSEIPTQAAPSPEATAAPLSIVPPPADPTPEAAPAGGVDETVPANEPTQTPVGEPTPPPTNVPAPEPVGEPVIPERNSDDAPEADGAAAPARVVSAETRQDGGFFV
jgi:hypothetical protein